MRSPENVRPPPVPVLKLTVPLAKRVAYKLRPEKPPFAVEVKESEDKYSRTLEFTNDEGRRYALNPEIATLIVRPRGWHLDEKHVLVDGKRVSVRAKDGKVSTITEGAPGSSSAEVTHVSSVNGAGTTNCCHSRTPVAGTGNAGRSTVTSGLMFQPPSGQ